MKKVYAKLIGRCECGKPAVNAGKDADKFRAGCAACIAIEDSMKGSVRKTTGYPEPASHGDIQAINRACDAFFARRGMPKQPRCITILG